jgi:hypothetical protein
MAQQLRSPSFPAPTIDCFYLFADVLPRDALASHGDSCCHTGKLTPLFKRSAITPWYKSTTPLELPVGKAALCAQQCSALQTCKSFEFLAGPHSGDPSHGIRTRCPKRSGGCPISCRAKSCARAIDGESLRLAPFPTLPVLQ